MEKRILCIGGSPCSGKSTVAERISAECGAYYFKVDDYLFDFIEIAAKRGMPTCKKILAYTPDETWLRNPSVQCEEEFLIYDEISKSVFERLNQIDCDFIVTEGAAYTPVQTLNSGIVTDYITIVPTAEFQVSHYKERKWVASILEGCSNKEQAFDNWMQRDVLFAKKITALCKQHGVPSVLNDGNISKDQMFLTVKNLFRLK